MNSANTAPKDEYPISTPDDEARRAAWPEEYRQWQEKSFLPQHGMGPYSNMPGPWSNPPYPAQPAPNGGYFGTQLTGAYYPGQYPPQYPRAQILGAGTPAVYYQAQSYPIAQLPASEASSLGAYVPGAHQSARRAQHRNPFLPQPRAAAHPSHDL